MPSIKSYILLIDEDDKLRTELRLMLEEKDLIVDDFTTIKEATFSLKNKKYDVIITNMHFRTEVKELDVLDSQRNINPSARIIITGAHSSSQDAFLAGGLGMFAYISKCDLTCNDQIMKAVENALVFDAFVSYNRDDQGEVRRLCDTLARNGLRVWVDYERISPGTSWIDAIEKVMSKCKTAIIVLGKSGLGNWQKEEKNLILQFANKNDKKIIPILLPGVSEPPADLSFLNSYTFLKLNTCLNTGCVCNKLIDTILDKPACYKCYIRFL